MQYILRRSADVSSRFLCRCERVLIVCPMQCNAMQCIGQTPCSLEDHLVSYSFFCCCSRNNFSKLAPISEAAGGGSKVMKTLAHQFKVWKCPICSYAQSYVITVTIFLAILCYYAPSHTHKGGALSTASCLPFVPPFNSRTENCRKFKFGIGLQVQYKKYIIANTFEARVFRPHQAQVQNDFIRNGDIVCNDDDTRPLLSPVILWGAESVWVENAGVENAVVENVAPESTDGKLAMRY